MKQPLPPKTKTDEKTSPTIRSYKFGHLTLLVSDTEPEPTQITKYPHLRLLPNPSPDSPIAA